MAYEPWIYRPLTSRLQVTMGYRFHRRSLDLPSPQASIGVLSSRAWWTRSWL